MIPERYRIVYSQSTDEVIKELARFVDYVKHGPVFNVLPNGLRDISARDHSDVAQWEERVEHVLCDKRALSATERFWLVEIHEVFKAARHRLEQLALSGEGRDTPGSFRSL